MPRLFSIGTGRNTCTTRSIPPGFVRRRPASLYLAEPAPKWRNWQTRYVQGVVGVLPSGFESLLRHRGTAAPRILQRRNAKCPFGVSSSRTPARGSGTGTGSVLEQLQLARAADCLGAGAAAERAQAVRHAHRHRAPTEKLRNRWSAISRLVCPAATRRSISSSRRVSPAALDRVAAYTARDGRCTAFAQAPCDQSRRRPRAPSSSKRLECLAH